MSFSPSGGTKSASPSHLAGFEGPLRGGERDVKREGERREGTEENNSPNTLNTLLIVTALLAVFFL